MGWWIPPVQPAQRKDIQPFLPQRSHNLLDALLEYPIRNEEGKLKGKGALL